MSASPTWSSPGHAQHDFRTDSHTTPTTHMLDALLHATFDDDVFREDSSTAQLEAAMAQMSGCEDACFALTGTMANQIALRVLFEQPPFALLTDKRAHILNYEAGGTAYLTGAMMQPVAPSNNLYLTLEDIKPRSVITDDVQKAPTKVISLENTAHGAITPLAEMRRISIWARQHGIKLHLDGARLFESIAAGAGSMRDFCALFDTIHLDFSKNLGAPIGTMVLGSRDLITRARRVRKALGGGLRPTGLICVMMRTAIEENFGWEGRGERAHGMRRSHAMAKRLGTEWQRRGGKLVRPVETNIVWLNIRAAGYTADAFVGVGTRYAVKLDGGRLVVHYQMTEESVQRMLRVFDECLATSKARL
ncbi:Alanine racemase TOXG [Penicillium brasilianum]|uniref:Alanine racemase TOXG n=1 Tax=Penicillium brasilianum TaxID=104259 RepID=A0A1S9RVF5_PENBI|nr:Alanine racemase TOXG [Penicillium brasilianum]